MIKVKRIPRYSNLSGPKMAPERFLLVGAVSVHWRETLKRHFSRMSVCTCLQVLVYCAAIGISIRVGDKHERIKHAWVSTRVRERGRTITWFDFIIIIIT